MYKYIRDTNVSWILISGTVHVSGFYHANHEETTLLNNGLQHSIETPLDRYCTDLAIETEQSILTQHNNMQSPLRILAITTLKQIRVSNSHQNPTVKRHTYLINSINDKLLKKDAIKAKADKGKA
jgi:hypothetical protein